MAEKDMEKAAQTAKSTENAQQKSKQEKKSQEKISKKEKKQQDKKLAEVEAQLAKEKDDNIRLLAEFENYRRRSAAERLELYSTASEKIILELLPVVDDFERAVKALGESSDNASAKEGTEMIYNKLVGILKSKGLKKIEVVGEPFNTETMEAVAQFPVQDEQMKGKVFDVVQNGYMLGEKVIRYAKVVVVQ